MKKFAMAAVAALSLSTASAESCASSFSGFYAGAQLGMNSVSGNTNYTTAAGNTTKTALGSKAFIGGLFAGYGMGVGSCAYVGGELYTNFGNNNVGILDDGHTKNTLKSTYNLGGKVRLGYTVSQQAMIFVGLGMERAKFQLKTVTDQATAGTYKKNKSAFTFAPSVGMDMFVNKNLFIRGEFTYVLAAKLKVDGAANRAAPLRAQTNDTAKVSVNQQRFTLGLGYKF